MDPLMWSEFLNRGFNPLHPALERIEKGDYWLEKNYFGALGSLYKRIMWVGYVEKGGLMSEFGPNPRGTDEVLKFTDEYTKLYRSNTKEFMRRVFYYSFLSRKEILELVFLFGKLWNIFKDAKPIVVHILASAPAIPVRFSKLNFNEFLDYCAEHNIQDLNTLSEWFSKFEALSNIPVYSRVPADYIVKFEYIE